MLIKCQVKKVLCKVMAAYQELLTDQYGSYQGYT